MTQSSEVSKILDRIAQEASDVVQVKKTVTRAKRTPRSAKPQRVQLSIPQSPRDPVENPFEKQWEPVEICLNSIMDSSGPGQFEPAFHAVERLCKNGENFHQISDRLNKRLCEFASAMCARLLPPLKVESVVATAQQCERIGILLSSVFSDFEAAFLAPMTVEGLLMNVMKQEARKDPNVISGICMAVNLDLNEQRAFVIEREKEVATVSPMLVQVSEFVEKLGVAGEVLESCARESAEFYRNLAVDAESPERFLLNVKVMIEKEQTIISPFSRAIQNAVVQQARKYLYVEKLTRDVSEYVTELVDSRNITCLKLLAALVYAAKDKELDDRMTKAWVRDTGKRVSAAIELKTLDIVKELLRVHDSLVACRSFFDPVHQKEIFRGFKSAVNQEANNVAFQMARFVHHMIVTITNDFIPALDRVMLLFRELESMDVFMEHHRQFLALRLLGYVKDPPKVEFEIIRKMAAICGDEEVKNMEGMISDIQASFQLTREFDAKSATPIRFTVMTITTWPTFPHISLGVPSDILDARARFADFYKSRNPSRKLSWRPELDDVAFRLNGCLFTGSSLYYVLLESIIEGKEFEQSGLSDKEIDAMLVVLVKTGVITIDQNKEKKIRPKMLKPRIKLPTPLALSPRQRSDRTIEEVEWARKMKIEAAIVLIMKRLKASTEDQIHSECLRIINFNMNRKDFDAAIASCIEKSYLTRGDDDLLMFSPF